MSTGQDDDMDGVRVCVGVYQGWSTPKSYFVFLKKKKEERERAEVNSSGYATARGEASTAAET